MTLLGLSREISHEVRGAWRLTATRRSFATYATDVFAHRALRVVAPRRDVRTIRLRDGVVIGYRRDRGDIFEIREVWIDEAYRLPIGLSPKVVVDLGAHIGLTTLWLAVHYRPSALIAVEPSAANVAIARANFERNDVRVDLVHAAVGSRDGVTTFQDARQSNLGRTGVPGETVQMVSMPSLLERLPPGTTIDLLKVDIEGAEEELFSGDLTWLGRIGAITGEFHGHAIDYPALAARLHAAGLQQRPLGQRRARA